MVISRRLSTSFGFFTIISLLFAATKAQINETQTDSFGMSMETTTTSGNMSESNMTSTTESSTTTTSGSTTMFPMMMNQTTQDSSNSPHPVGEFPPPPPPPPVPGMMIPGQEGNQPGMTAHPGMGHPPMPGGMNDFTSGPHDNKQSTPNNDGMGSSTTFPNIVNVNHNENVDKTKYDVLNAAGRNAGDSPMSNPGSTVGYSKEIGARPSGNPNNSARRYGFENCLLAVMFLSLSYHLKFIF